MIGAYVVVRIGVLLFAASLGNKSWMQHLGNARGNAVIWLAIAAEYLGWLDPIISTLGQHRRLRPARAASPSGRC